MNVSAIQIEIPPAGAVNSAGNTPAGLSGGSFEDHFGRALGNGDSAPTAPLPHNQKDGKGSGPYLGVVPAPQANPSQPTTPPNGQSSRSQGGSGSYGSYDPPGPSGPSGPVLIAAYEGGAAAPVMPVQSSGFGSQAAVASRTSWLAHMLPDILIGQKSTGGDGGADSTPGSSSSSTASSAPATSSLGSIVRKISALAEGLAGISGLQYPAQEAVSQSPKSLSPTSFVHTDAAAASRSQTAGAETSAPQGGAQVQEAMMSLEKMGLLSAASSASASGSALPNSAKSVPMSPVEEVKKVAAPSGLVNPSKPAVDNASQGTGLAGGGSQASSSHGDSAPPVKSEQETSGGNQKNGSSPDPKPSNSSQATGAISAAASNGAASSAGAAAQIASNSFPMVLNQAAGAASAAARQGTATVSTSSTPGVSEKIAAAIENPANAPGAVVSAASLIQSQDRAEMHVALQTESMGALQLHAVLDNGRVGASISVVSHEAHTLLSNELPALQQVLTDQNIRVDRLTVVNSPMSSGAGAGDGRGFQSGNFNSPRDPAARWLSTTSPSESASKEVPAPEDIRRRLSVRA